MFRFMNSPYSFQTQNKRPAGPVSLTHALSSEQGSLGRIQHKLRLSQQCWQACTGVLPPALQQAVQLGPVEEGTWSLFVPNNAVAAKLRQLLPTLLQRAQHIDNSLTAIRVKVLSGV
jgi:hypothetical protein